VHRAKVRHADQIHSLEVWLGERHAAAARHSHALWEAQVAAARSRASHRSGSARVGAGRVGYVADHHRVGDATWYAWYPGQCASPFLPHGTLLTVTDLTTGKTIHCLVTDTEAHNPGRVVDLSTSCFEELAALSQGVIEVRVSW
jgi:hypothetical protein